MVSSLTNRQGDPRPIGVFDSGIGGLTVLRELLRKFPEENFIYLGDTARLPYGSKSAATVRLYSEQNMEFLISKNVKAIVVACNTASTQIFESHYKNRPVYNVIDPGSLLATSKSKNKNIAVLATRATVKANTYETKIKKIDPSVKVTSIACPLFVSLAEEGWHDDPITSQIAQRYLGDLVHKNIDTIVLGCTHYPLLKKSIQKIFSPETILIDSGEAIAEIMQLDFKTNILLTNTENPWNEIIIGLTDIGPQFENLALSLLSEYSQKKIKFEVFSVI